MKTIKRYIFECPECQGNKIVKVVSNVTIREPISTIGKDNVMYDSPKIDTDLGEGEVKFVCSNCHSFVANTEDDVKLMTEKDFYLVEESFVEGILDIFDSDVDKEKLDKMIRKFLLTRDIEVREKDVPPAKEGNEEK